MTILRNFWNDEQGQDLIEYTLLMAFVALASAALFWARAAASRASGPLPTASSFRPIPRLASLPRVGACYVPLRAPSRHAPFSSHFPLSPLQSIQAPSHC